MADKIKFKWRVFTSFMMFSSFTIEGITGIALYIAPPGRVAHWTNWKFLGLTKTIWQSWHTLFGYVFIAIAILHIIFNWKPLIHYLKSKTKEKLKYKKEIYATILMILLFSAGSIFNIPPFSSVFDLGEKISESWENKDAAPPIPHSERMTIEEFSKYIEIKPENIFEIFKKQGIIVDDKNKTLEQIATDNNITPENLFEIIKENRKDQTTEIKRGYGRMTIKVLSIELRVKPDKIINILKNNGINAKPEDRLKELAEKYNKTPLKIFDIIEKGLKK